MSATGTEEKDLPEGKTLIDIGQLPTSNKKEIRKLVSETSDYEDWDDYNEEYANQKKRRVVPIIVLFSLFSVGLTAMMVLKVSPVVITFLVLFGLPAIGLASVIIMHAVENKVQNPSKQVFPLPEVKEITQDQETGLAARQQRPAEASPTAVLAPVSYSAPKERELQMPEESEGTKAQDKSNHELRGRIVRSKLPRPSQKAKQAPNGTKARSIRTPIIISVKEAKLVCNIVEGTNDSSWKRYQFKENAWIRLQGRSYQGKEDDFLFENTRTSQVVNDPPTGIDFTSKTEEQPKP